MRVHLVEYNCNNPEAFQDAVNYKIDEIESEDSNGYVLDIKFSIDPIEPAQLCALILWESKDVEDKTRTRLFEEHYRGRYKTW